ncbi:MAG: alpha-amylase family protein [Gammaproteobacteria bacterium]|nr:alpha-amylase family protein [Gammaproteobacteria bacterium]
MKTRLLAPLAYLLVAACGEEPAAPAATAAPAITDGVFVQMFEWPWTDLARECEEHLGPAGYQAVQTSPPQEHIPGPDWWTRYQPVSYLVESRSGSREEFADMVARCKAAGVDVYADAVINHMADVGTGSGVAGSGYTEFSYPVPYGYDDFHRCGRNENNSIRNYQDKWEVQNCQLGGLADIDTGRPSVQAKIAAYLNDLLSLGVSGFRLDAVKHIAAEDVAGILSHVDGDPFIVQEVIDRGGEPIKSRDYVGTGRITEFRYSSGLVDAFLRGKTASLNEIGGPEWLESERAIVFIDNHDSQRSHLGADVLNYKSAAVYDLATVFMLAYPYGYPMLMSSYAFEHDDDPVPTSSPHDSGCGADWVCEHRRDTATRMVRFRQVVAGSSVEHWQAKGDVVSFSRGGSGHVVINIGDATIETTVSTAMPDGEYVDLLGGAAIVIADGQLRASLAPQSAAAVLANHGPANR